MTANNDTYCIIFEKGHKFETLSKLIDGLGFGLVTTDTTVEIYTHTILPVRLTEIKTTIKTLDSYNLAPSFIKMDVEESESDVIMGGIETISKHKPTLQVEGKGSMELIKSLGYRLVAQRKCHGALHDNIYVYG